MVILLENMVKTRNYIIELFLIDCLDPDLCELSISQGFLVINGSSEDTEPICLNNDDLASLLHTGKFLCR